MTWAQAIRPHGDPFGGYDDDIRPHDDSSGDSDVDDNTVKYPTRYSYPSWFELGSGRAYFVQLKLCCLFGRMGWLRNEINFLRRLQRKSSHEFHQAAILDRYENRLDASATWANSMIGELIAIGASYHIPYNMADMVHAPMMRHGCMACLAEENNFICENFGGEDDEHLVDVGDATHSVLTDSWIEGLIQLDKINSSLNIIYQNLAHRLNRVQYHSWAYRVLTMSDTPRHHQQTKKVNEKFVRIHFDNAVRIINAKIGTHGSKLFNMPDLLREQVMGSEDLKQLEPMLDCSGQFHNFINRINVNPDDDMDMAIAQLVSINKSINYLSLRLRQLFSARFPELGKIVDDNHLYARVVKFIANKPFLGEQDMCDLSVIIGNADKAKEIIDASKSSIGHELSLRDSDIIDGCAQMVINQFAYRKKHYGYTVNKMSDDEVVIRQLTQLDSIDMGINYLSKNLRRLLSVGFPELVNIVNDNNAYAKLAKFIMSKPVLRNQDLSDMAAILGSKDKAKEVLNASKASMGQDLSVGDKSIILSSADVLLGQFKKRESQLEHLKGKMESFAPNIKCLIGAHLGARLISCAGSLSNLASLPSSTIQVLGADTISQNGGNTPRYGIIYNHILVARASTKNKGRMACYMASQCGMAARVDCYSDAKSFGENLWDRARKMLNYFEKKEEKKEESEEEESEEESGEEESGEEESEEESGEEESEQEQPSGEEESEQEQPSKEEESEQEQPRIGQSRRRRAVKFLRKLRRRMV